MTCITISAIRLYILRYARVKFKTRIKMIARSLYLFYNWIALHAYRIHVIRTYLGVCIQCIIMYIEEHKHVSRCRTHLIILAMQISDFGLAKCLPYQCSQIMTEVEGTFGWIITPFTPWIYIHILNDFHDINFLCTKKFMFTLEYVRQIPCARICHAWYCRREDRCICFWSSPPWAHYWVQSYWGLSTKPTYVGMTFHALSFYLFTVIFATLTDDWPISNIYFTPNLILNA